LIDKLSIFKKPFIIPSLPKGKTLEFNILQTWGDINYLGMTGIEIFDSEGNQINATEITANPSDINLLMG
jgi:protein JBTS26